MVQRWENKILALKKQVSNNSYKDIPRRTFPNYSGNRNQNRLPTPQGRISLEPPPINATMGYYKAEQDKYAQLKYPMEEDIDLFQDE